MENQKGKILGTYLGVEDETYSVAVEKMILEWNGVRGDRHYGRTKFAGVREKHFPKYSEMLNLRQVSIVAKEELAKIAKNMGLKEIHAEDLGANLLVSGIKAFTKIPFGSVMLFKRGAALLLTGDNFPCIYPGKEIAKRESNEKLAPQFAKNAMHIRGQTALILKAGIVKPDDEFELIIPPEVKTAFAN